MGIRNGNQNSAEHSLEELAQKAFWRVSEMATLVGCSEKHLERRFHELFNQTPHDWLNDAKFTRARVLLRKSRKSIKEIAKETGFENGSYFCTWFKKMNGITPTEFRKNLL
jgi:AraC-like DNA-binding protein